MIERYLKLAIHYDYPFNITKYCLQQLLGSEQESDHGKAFLACATLGEFEVRVSIVVFVWSFYNLCSQEIILKGLGCP